MQIILGGMVYDEKKGKGIRRKFLPEPNPTTIDFNKDGTLHTICEKAIELFYKEFKSVSTDDIKIADSSGNVISCDFSQKVSEYYGTNGYLPSRHKLYTVLYLTPKVYTLLHSSLN